MISYLSETHRGFVIFGIAQSSYPAAIFSTPLFVKEGGGNEIFVQEASLSEERVLRFNSTYNIESISIKNHVAAVKTGDDLVYSIIVDKNDVRFGTKQDLIPIAEIILQSRKNLNPLQTLSLIEFCNKTSAICDSVKKAFQYIEGISKESAILWRDISILSNRVRRSALKFLSFHENAAEVRSDIWGCLYAKGNNHQLDVLYHKESKYITGEFLREWLPVFNEDIREYCLAFDLDYSRINVVSVPVVSKLQERDISHVKISKKAEFSGISSMQNNTEGTELYSDKRKFNHSFLLLPFGRNIVHACERVQDRFDGVLSASRMHTPWLDFLKSYRYSDVVGEILDQASRRYEKITTVIVFDHLKDTFESIETFEAIHKIPGGSHAIFVFRPLISNEEHDLEKFGDFISRIFKHFRRVTVIVNNGNPTGDGEEGPKATFLLENYFDFLLSLDSRLSDFLSRRTLSLFAVGTTRSGAKDWRSGLLRALRSSLTPWVKTDRASAVQLCVASVGSPPAYTRANVVNAGLGSFWDEVPIDRLQLDWQRRRFVPGAVIGASVFLLVEGAYFTDEVSRSDIAKCAEEILSSAGYECKPIHNEIMRPWEYDVYDGKSKLFSFCAYDSKYHVQRQNSIVYIVGERSELRSIVRERHGNLFVLYSDLGYLEGSTDIEWSLYFLHVFQMPPRHWRELLEEMVSSKLSDLSINYIIGKIHRDGERSMTFKGVVENFIFAELKVSRVGFRRLLASGSAIVTIRSEEGGGVTQKLSYSFDCYCDTGGVKIDKIYPVPLGTIL